LIDIDASELRSALEGMAAKFAAERSHGAIQCQKLSSIVRDIDVLLEDSDDEENGFEGYVEPNEQFHTEKLTLAKCALLDRSLGSITALPFASPSSFVRVQANVKQSRQVLMIGQFQHQCLLEAIESGDAARAQSLAQEHARLAAGNLKRAINLDHLFVQVPSAQLIGMNLEEAKLVKRASNKSDIIEYCSDPLSEQRSAVSLSENQSDIGVDVTG
jgi:GntR family transcriptional regulator, vanillate catabolism transcriptional regulator